MQYGAERAAIMAARMHETAFILLSWLRACCPQQTGQTFFNYAAYFLSRHNQPKYGMQCKSVTKACQELTNPAISTAIDYVAEVPDT